MAIHPLHEENTLLIKIAEGDQTAFCTLFDYYRKYVYSFGRKLTRSEEMAEEIVQDVFLKVWLGRAKLKSVDSFGAYINTLVRNHSFNLLRQTAYSQKISQEILRSLSDKDNSTQQVLDYKEMVDIVDEGLELLTDQQRMVYTLCHRDGLKYEEAARKMNVSPATIHYHMKLALSIIREYLKKNAITHSGFLLFALKILS